jgi:alpha-N-acetylglucosamine transferase
MFSTFISDIYFHILNRDLNVFLVPFWRSAKCDITKFPHVLKYRLNAGESLRNFPKIVNYLCCSR